MLARLWPKEMAAPLWQRRTGAAPIKSDDLVWSILSEADVTLPHPVSAVIVLAGVAQGTAEDLRLNTTLAQAGCRLAQRLGVKALVASSQAVYGRQTGALRETDTPTPATPYGQAKRDMEQAISGRADVTCLRIGNVAGCDGLFQAMARGPVKIDQFADGQGPRRMMIGPRDLGCVLASMSQTQIALPKVLNIARPDLVAMNRVAQEAGVPWQWQPAPDSALPVLMMDVAALGAHIHLPSATATDMVAQARAGG